MLHAVTLKKPREGRNDEPTLIVSYLKCLAQLSEAPVCVAPRGANIEVTSQSEDSLRRFMERSQMDLLKPCWQQIQSTRER